MNEIKETDLELVNVTESIVTVNSVVTSTETVINKAVTGCEFEESREQIGMSEKDEGPCEVVDVMVEVFGSEVIVDGFRRVSGEMVSEDSGCRNGDFGTMNEDSEVYSCREVNYTIDCQDGGFDKPEVDSDSCADGNVACQLRDQCVGGDDTSLANIDSQDCKTCDVDNEKAVQVVVEDDIVRQLGDACEKKDAELPNNGSELIQDSKTHIVEDKSNDTKTSDEKMGLDDKDNLETLKQTREQDSGNEVNQHAVLEAGTHGHSTVVEDETVNGAINLVGASITSDNSFGCSVHASVSSETSPEKLILESNYYSSDLCTPIDRIDHMDGTNESIPAPVPDTPINMIKESPQFVEDEKFKDTSLTARVGHENGTVDGMKVDVTDMEIDAASGSVVHSEIQLVDKGGEIENNVTVISLSEVPVEETLFIGMNSDASCPISSKQEMNSDASCPISLKQGMVCEAPHDDLKYNSENQEPGAHDNTEESEPIESATMVKQCVEAVGKIENTVEHLSTCSQALDATDDSGAVKSVIQEPECKSNASPIECLDSQVTDGVAEIGLQKENVQELQGVIQEPECKSNASPIECLDSHVTDGVAEIGPQKENVQELQGVIQELECKSNASPIECLDSHVTDRVAEIGPQMENVQEFQGVIQEPESKSNSSPLVCLDSHATDRVAEIGPLMENVQEFQGLIQEPECKSNASPIECLDSHATHGVAEIGPHMGNLQEFQEVMYTDLVAEDCALPNENHDVNVLQSVRLDAGGDEKAIMKVQDEQVTLINPITNEEDKTIKLADPVIPSIENVTGSNMEAAREIQKVFSTDSVMSVDNSNMEGMKEVQEEAVNADGAVYMNNEALDEEEAPKIFNSAPSATADTHAEQSRLDENVTEGPFVVEIEGSSDSAVGMEYVDTDPGPMHDGIGKSDSHVLEMPHSPYNPLVEGLGVEAADHDAKTDSDMEDAQDKRKPDNAEQVEEQQFDEERVSSSAKSRNKEKNINAYTKSESLLKDHRVSYHLPLEIQGEFSVSDLVWGKVKSHPWWPGQIFHPSDSSEKAMKYFRKDCYLVAYFGDRTFAWNDASVLKPFRNHFSVAERQNKTEAFQNAVSCALGEVSRRMELGLACSCVSRQAYDKIRFQMVENTGIRRESSKRLGADRCSGVEYFQPNKLIEYVRSLAIFPTGSVDRLELVIAKAHLVAFLRLKGIDCLSDYQYYEGISSEVEHEDSATTFDSKTKLKGPKRKHNLKDIVYQRREKSMSELMGETMYYLDSEFDSHEEDESMLTSPSLKRKASGFNDFTLQPATKTISVAKVSNKASYTPQQSFKVGECIQRVASQLAGSSSILRSGSDGGGSEHLEDAVDEVVEASGDSPTEMSPSPSHEPSLDEMLSQLHLSAQDPMKGYSFLGEIVGFFAEFRNLAVSNQRQRMRRGPGRKRKSSTPVLGTPETFEFDDRNDSYWRDMVVQNNAEAKPARRSRKRKDEQVLFGDSEKPSQSKPRKSSRKQYFHGSLGSTVETPSGDKERQNELPTELLLNFTGMGTIPSEINLNKMFRCFGSLKESETEIDVQSSRARVVFKKRSDAEVAYSSAAMFNIFGSLLVNYQLNYTPSGSLKTCPIELTDYHETTA